MMQRTAFLLVVLGGCSGAMGARSDIPVAERPLWDRCRPALDAWCHDRSLGDPSLERECEANTGNDYIALPNEAAQRQFLRAHRCQL